MAQHRRKTGAPEAATVPPKESGRLRLAILAAVALFGLYAAIAHFVLLDYPDSGDEYSYALQAKIFASGRLSAPSVAPEIRPAFAVDHVIDNGKVVSKYPPGWPLLLTPATWLKVPWLTNPALGALFAFLLFLVVRSIAGARAGWSAMLVGGLSSFVAFQAASLASHMSTLCLATLALWLLVRPDGGASTVTLALVGAVVGFIVLARPLDGMLIGAALFGWFRPAEYKRAARIALGLLPMLLLFLGYNAVQFGSPFTTGYEVYRPTMMKLMGQQPVELSLANLEFLGAHLGWWIDARDWIVPGVMLLAPIGAYRLLVSESETARRAARYCLALLGLLLVVTQLYPPFSGDGYGPRYLMAAVLPLAVFAAAGAGQLWEGRLCPRGVVVGAVWLCVAISIGVGVRIAKQQHQKVLAELKLSRDVEAQDFHRAVVFLGRTFAHPTTWYVRNGIDFRGPVVFAIDISQQADEVLMAHYPGYQGYRYEWQTGTFKPLGRGP